MRQARMKVTSGEDSAVYHCVSRVVDRRFIFGDAEREMFVQFLREYEKFCGVQVLIYCLMSNYFHILVEVPKRPEVLPDEVEVLRRLKGLSGAAISAGKAQQMLAMFAEAKDDKGAVLSADVGLERVRQITQATVHAVVQSADESEDRFKSVLVQGDGDPSDLWAGGSLVGGFDDGDVARVWIAGAYPRRIRRGRNGF